MTSFSKLNDFTKELNRSMPSMKNFMIQLPNGRLDKLLTELSDELQIEDEKDVYIAVKTVGKNFTRNGEPVWVLNKDLALDKNGCLVNLQDLGLIWISHLTDADGINVARGDLAAIIQQPLGTEAFELVCHFLKGTIQELIKDFPDTRQSINNMIADQGLQYTTQDGNEENEAENIVDTPIDEVTVDNRNFLSQFFVISTIAIAANYTEWQKVMGFCPLVVAVGRPGSGKTKAGNTAIACTGSYPQHFYNLFTDAYTGHVSSMTTLGFQADDPSDPTEVGKAAKRFFSDGLSGNCQSQLNPKCSPIFTVNSHVIRWLQHPDRQRLMERVLLIHVVDRNGRLRDEEAVKWNGRFCNLLRHLSQTVGHIIRLGQEIHSPAGREFFSSCAEIASAHLKVENERLTQMWACVIYCARKMAELTTAVSDCDLIQHFKEVLVPYVNTHQISHHTEKFLTSPSSRQLSNIDEGSLVEELSEVLTKAVDGEVPQQVQSFLLANKKARIGVSEEPMLAVRVRQLSEICQEKAIEWKEMANISNAVGVFNLGRQNAQHRFYSPKKGQSVPKHCVMLKRSLFKDNVLQKLDKACYGENVAGRSNSAESTVSKEKAKDEEITEKLKNKEKELEKKEEELNNLEDDLKKREDELKKTENKKAEEIVMQEEETKRKGEELEIREQELKKKAEELVKQEEKTKKKGNELEMREQELKKKAEDLAKQEEKVKRQEEELKRKAQEMEEEEKKLRKKMKSVEKKEELLKELEKLKTDREKLQKNQEEVKRKEEEIADRKRELEKKEEDVARTHSGLPFQIKVSSTEPTPKKRRQGQSKTNEEDKELCNICSTKSKRAMVECTKCRQWQHSSCAKFPVAKAKKNPFICKKC